MTDSPKPRIHPNVPAIVLAPMEGMADVTMRALLSEIGGFTYGVAEFLRISKAVPGPRAFQRLVPELLHGAKTAAGLPVQVQLLGGDPDKLAAAALMAVRAGARAVDLNFGCPAPTVNRHDGGATLLQYPDRIHAIVAAVRAATPPDVPVSAKLRLGWDDMRAIHVNADRAADAGADWITIHARTKFQGYRPPAYWKPIAEVRARLGIPVVANGEIWNLDDLRRCIDETGCRHFMLGRGVLADPSLAGASARELGLPGGRLTTPVTNAPATWLPLVRRFAEIGAGWGLSSRYIVARLKKWLGLANHDKKLIWFDAALKRRVELAEFDDHIAALAAQSLPCQADSQVGASWQVAPPLHRFKSDAMGS